MQKNGLTQKRRYLAKFINLLQAFYVTIPPQPYCKFLTKYIGQTLILFSRICY